MNKKKIVIVTILALFVVGMIIGAADATFYAKCGKYKVKLTAKEYKKIYNGKTVTKKTGKYKVVKEKIPKYKTVKTKKWVYKTVCYERDDHYENGITFHEYNDDKYWKNGWKLYKSYYKYKGDSTYFYHTWKKKKTVKEKKIVSYKIKKVKVPIKLSITAYNDAPPHDFLNKDDDIYGEAWNEYGPIYNGVVKIYNV